MSSLLNMMNGGVSADLPVSPRFNMLKDTDIQSQSLSIHPLNGAQPQAIPFTNTANNQPQPSNNLLSLLASRRANRSQPDDVPLFQPRPTFRPIPIRAPGAIVTDHSRANATPNLLLGPVDVVPRLNTGAPQPQLGAFSYQTPHSDVIINVQPHRPQGLRDSLENPIIPMTRRVVELRSPPQLGQISPPDIINTNLPRTNDQPNLLSSPIDIVPRPRVVEDRSAPQPHTVSRHKTTAGTILLNPNAEAFVPSWHRSPDLFGSWNPSRVHTPEYTLIPTPGLTPDRSPDLVNAPCRSLDYTHKLTTKCIQHVKAELLRPPPVLVPSRYRRRPSPGLFLYSPPPPGLPRHTAYSPHHPAGIAPMSLPPVEISYNPALGHHRYHSQKMIARLGLKDVKYLNGCAWHWELSGEKVDSVTDKYLEKTTSLSVPLT